MLRNVQTDKKWGKDIMTSCHEKDRTWKDYLWRWGCLVTCIANILGYTPRELNQTIRREKAYKYLHENKTPENQASFLMLEELKNILGIEIINNLSYKEYNEAINIYWIARVIHKSGGGHYINVLKKFDKKWLCFDVEYGNEIILKDKDITKLIKVIL
jgi:hypothetical protein